MRTLLLFSHVTCRRIVFLHCCFWIRRCSRVYRILAKLWRAPVPRLVIDKSPLTTVISYLVDKPHISGTLQHAVTRSSRIWIEFTLLPVVAVELHRIISKFMHSCPVMHSSTQAQILWIKLWSARTERWSESNVLFELPLNAASLMGIFAVICALLRLSLHSIMRLWSTSYHLYFQHGPGTCTYILMAWPRTFKLNGLAVTYWYFLEQVIVHTVDNRHRRVHISRKTFARGSCGFLCGFISLAIVRSASKHCRNQMFIVCYIRL